VYEPAVEVGEELVRLLAAVEAVARHGAPVARERVVHDEADLDEQRAALARLAAPVR
jgi:hypothetical protein